MLGTGYVRSVILTTLVGERGAGVVRGQRGTQPPPPTAEEIAEEVAKRKKYEENRKIAEEEKKKKKEDEERRWENHRLYPDAQPF